MRVGIVLVLPLVLAAGGIAGVSRFSHRVVSEPTFETTISRYADELRAIGSKTFREAPSQTKEAPARLAEVKADTGKVEKIARDIEQRLATKTLGCAFAKAAADNIESEFLRAATQIDDALDRLFSETKQRHASLVEQNTALGWVGWRGSRETEIHELVLFAHAIVTTTADADLALARLQLKASVLNKLASTCATTATENRAALPR
jgi:hypothetical protein